VITLAVVCVSVIAHTSNHLNWIKNKKVLKGRESKEGKQWGKTFKMKFVSWKMYLSSCYFFISFSFALQRWFLEFEVAFP